VLKIGLYLLCVCVFVCSVQLRNEHNDLSDITLQLHDKLHSVNDVSLGALSVT
jgi:hypothetical protein